MPQSGFRKPAHSGYCRTRQTQNLPPQGGKLRRPSHLKTADLHSFRDYCRGDEPQASNGSRILFKNNGASNAPQASSRLAGLLNPAKPLDPAEHLDPAMTAGTARPNPARQDFSNKPAPPLACSSFRPRVSSHPIPAIRWDESSFRDEQSKSAPPMPLVSRGVATVPHLPADQGRRGYSAPVVTADASNRQPERAPL